MISFFIQEKRKIGKEWVSLEIFLEKLKFSFVLTVAIFYTLIFSSLISPFNCVLQGDGSYSLWYDSTITCFEGAWMQTHLPVIVIFIIIYCLVFPALMIREFTMFRKGSGNPDQCSELFQVLTRSYRPSLYWWECVQLLKRVVIILFGTLDSGIGTEKYLSMFIVLLVFLMTDLIAFPYERKSLMKIAMLWNCTVFFTLMADGLVFRSKTATETQISVCIGLVMSMIIISFLTSIYQLYRNRFLKIRKRFFPAQLSHLDESSNKIFANFTPDKDFLSAFKSENVLNSKTKIRVQWNEDISNLSSSISPDQIEAIQMIRPSTSTFNNTSDKGGLAGIQIKNKSFANI